MPTIKDRLTLCIQVLGFKICIWAENMRFSITNDRLVHCLSSCIGIFRDLYDKNVLIYTQKVKNMLIALN